MITKFTKSKPIIGINFVILIVLRFIYIYVILLDQFVKKSDYFFGMF